MSFHLCVIGILFAGFLDHALVLSISFIIKSPAKCARIVIAFLIPTCTVVPDRSICYYGGF